MLPQTHVPFWHPWFCPQTLPQAPQLAASVLMFLQVPLQQVCPGPHAGLQVNWQVPFTQFWPLAHAWPHPPQLFTSVLVFTHVPLHALWPAGHATHWGLKIDPLQICPAGQTLPQAPQLLGSVDMLTQVGLPFTEQTDCPPGQKHAFPNPPFSQLWPTAQHKLWPFGVQPPPKLQSWHAARLTQWQVPF